MSSVPTEFLVLGLDCGKFFRKRHNEYAGPCPFCKGRDRFVIFTNRPFPHWNWFCRKCGRNGWADNLNTRLREELTPELRAEYARKNQEAEIARKNAQATALARYQKSRIWEKYHENLAEEHRAWWHSQGIPDKWQDFWQLGYTPHLSIGDGGSAITRNAYTIPKFGFGWKPTNLDYRIIDPPPEMGKYRSIKGLPIAPFISFPTTGKFGEPPRIFGIPGCNSWADIDKVARKYKGLMYIVEGAKKAMVLACHNSLPDFLARSECCWIMLDPGAEEWARRLATIIGKHAIVVELPEKPDDMVLAGATRYDFLALMREAKAKREDSWRYNEGMTGIRSGRPEMAGEESAPK